MTEQRNECGKAIVENHPKESLHRGTKCSCASVIRRPQLRRHTCLPHLPSCPCLPAQSYMYTVDVVQYVATEAIWHDLIELCSPKRRPRDLVQICAHVQARPMDGKRVHGDWAGRRQGESSPGAAKVGLYGSRTERCNGTDMGREPWAFVQACPAPSPSTPMIASPSCPPGYTACPASLTSP